MILVDSSVWIDHLRSRDELLSGWLENGQVATHPLVLGEMACGHLRRRSQLLGWLDRLPRYPEASHSEARAFIEQRQLAGCGIGIVDVHLLASAALAGDGRLWTHDRRLLKVARQLGLALATQ